MKFDIEECDRELSCHINHRLGRTILRTTLQDDLQAFASHK
jgi:hypothetical protein